MKRVIIVIAAVLLIPLGLLALGDINGGGPSVVDSATAAKLYGGYCGSASYTKTCQNSQKKGCVKTDCEYFSGSGSWVQKDNPYCGVQECGSVINSKKCDA